MRRRPRFFSFWALAAAITAPLLGAACGDGETDGPAPDDGGGQGGAANDGATGGRGDAGSGSGGRLGGSGGRDGSSGSGGAAEVPGCLEDQFDATCTVATATAAASWHCTLRFPTDLSAEEGTAARVFVACAEEDAAMGGAGGGAPLWTFDHRTDTLRLGRDLCEGLDEGAVVTAVAGCSQP
jgi:hypothetical protein